MQCGTTSSDGAVIAFAATEWPFIFKEIEGIVNAEKSAFYAALQANFDGNSPRNIRSVHVFLLYRTTG
ncbi:hypothetical protein LCM4573_24815 [Rhizobium sp. LCM 4573]|nr:hypothetical protein LCM4573_24815 [Rhizobium sp. LCM 4573]